MGRGKRQHNHQGINLNVARFTTADAAGIISAYQSGQSVSDNEAAHVQLGGQIRSRNYGQTTIEGRWIRSSSGPESETVPEKAIQLVGGDSDSGNMKGFLKNMMAEYGQMAAIYKAARNSEIVLLFADGSQAPISLSELQNFSGVYQQIRGVTETAFCLDGFSVAKNWLGQLAEQVKNKR